MRQITLKTVKRKTSVPRSVIRAAVAQTIAEREQEMELAKKKTIKKEPHIASKRA